MSSTAIEMDSIKNSSSVQTASSFEHQIEDVEDAAATEATKGGTKDDDYDMRRMGKLQELRRNFRFVSIWGFSLLLGNAWVVALISSNVTLANGGMAGGVWMFLIVAVGMFFCMLSMAEMASMAPTAGGQYHWVSEFAPPKYQRFLSYMVGWMCVLGWQAAMCASAYTPALNIQGLIALNVEGYTLPGWHAALMTIGIVIICILINTVAIKKLPLLEGFMLLFFFFSFFTIIVVLWVMAERTPAKKVFTEFSDNMGWGNVGLSTLIGILSPFTTLLGSDSACHLSEELKDASWVLPRSMAATAVVNYALGFVTVITLMFTLGGSVQSVLDTEFGQGYIQVFYNAVQSKAGASGLTAIVCILLFFTAINQVTTTSRQLFAFARDGGLPFSAFLGRVRPGMDIPLNACTVTVVLTVLISLIVIGSNTAFNVITSLSSVGLLTSYIICIGCMARKRIMKEVLLPSRFSLGRWGLAINLTAIIFLSFCWVLLFFPSRPHPDAQNMNWTILIYGVTWIAAVIYYIFKGRYDYAGPVEGINKDY
ncbi:amino acid transporter, partial [Aureobasidium melanogenum]